MRRDVVTFVKRQQKFGWIGQYFESNHEMCRNNVLRTEKVD